jgi:hypothetical protein
LHIHLPHLWQYAEMARKKKPKKFNAIQAVKAAAREKIGRPRPTRAVPVSVERKGRKHKPTLGRLLAEE